MEEGEVITSPNLPGSRPVKRLHRCNLLTGLLQVNQESGVWQIAGSWKGFPFQQQVINIQYLKILKI